MRIGSPITVATGSTLTSTNVGTGADPAAYNAGTTYALADRSVVGEVIYESIQAGNLGNAPASSPLWWATVGAINSMAMFDRRVGSQTTNADTILVVITPGEIVNVLSLLKIGAASVTVTQTDPVEGVVYTETQSLIEPSGGGWYAYLYGGQRVKTDALFIGFKPYRNATITVLIDNTGGTAACGLLAVGPSVVPGAAKLGASDGLQDYSRVEEDEWGIRDIVERDYADDAELTVDVESWYSPTFRRLLASRRALPTLLTLADERPDAQYYGLISFRRVFSFNDIDTYSITLKGFT